MLIKENRLKKKIDFETVFKKGKGFGEGFLILKTAKNKLDKSRFGFIVSKKTAKKAVVRNKIRRRLGSIIRGRLKEVQNSFDNIIIALPGSGAKSFKETEEAVIKLLKKAKLL